jgi:sorbitol-specific phosphotransferase system component IIC
MKNMQIYYIYLVIIKCLEEINMLLVFKGKMNLQLLLQRLFKKFCSKYNVLILLSNFAFCNLIALFLSCISPKIRAFSTIL